MSMLNKRQILTYLLIIFFGFTPFYISITNNSFLFLSEQDLKDKSEEQSYDIETLKLSAEVVSQLDRSGKVFSTGNIPSQNCYINNENPDLSILPSIYKPNYYMSYASMNINDLEALNYTKDIENSFTEAIESDHEEKYIFQKFAIRVSQYVNNVSIIIQDYFQGHDPVGGGPPDPIYTDTNYWEVY